MGWVPAGGRGRGGAGGGGGGGGGAGGQGGAAAGAGLAGGGQQHELTRYAAGVIPGTVSRSFPVIWKGCPQGMRSSEEEEQQARLERARAIGLFRYMLIREAADPALSSRQRGAMVRELACREHAGPSGQPVRVTRWTLDKWIRLWREGGVDALVPHPRQSQPRTPPEVIELAAALKKENPARTAAQVQRMLKAQSGGAPDGRAIQRMFNPTGLRALTPPEAA